VLETVIVDGLAAEAAAVGYRWPHVRRLATIGALLVGTGLGLFVVTGRPAWLLLLAAFAMLALVSYRARRTQLASMLRPGAAMTAAWGASSLVVTRPTSTMTFAYDGMELDRRARRLVHLTVAGQVTPRRRSILSLPVELAPAEALARLSHHGVPGADPFGAEGMTLTFRSPEGFPSVLLPMPAWRRVVVVLLLGVEVLCLAAIAAVGSWELSLVMAVMVSLLLWSCFAPIRAARRRYRAGALVGASFDAGRVVLALPDQRIDVPEARVRRLATAGPELASFTFSAIPGALLVPRAVVPDAEIDRLRALLGKGPIPRSQRIDLEHAFVR